MAGSPHGAASTLGLALSLAAAWGCGALADSKHHRRGGPSACADGLCNEPDPNADDIGIDPAPGAPLPSAAPGPQMARRCGGDGVVPGNVEASTQADLDALAGCVRIAGDFVFNVFGFSDPTPLSSLRQVDGVLAVQGYAEANARALDGFTSLAQVGALRLQDLKLLTLAPLAGLQRIDAGRDQSLGQSDPGALEIYRCSELQSLKGLDGLVSGLQALTLVDNPDLASLEGMPQLPRISQLYASNVPLVNLQGISGISIQSLTIVNSGLQTLEGMGTAPEGGRLVLLANPALTSLRGAESLHELESLGLQSNASLVDLRGLEGLSRVSEVALSGPHLASLAGLEGLQQVNTLSIAASPELTSLDGLSGLTSAEILRVEGSPIAELHGLRQLRSAALELIGTQLESLDGLDTLETLNWLILSDSPALASLQGLPALRSAESISVDSAPALVSLAGLGSAEVGILSLSGVSASDLAGLEQVRVIRQLDIGGTGLLSLNGAPQLGEQATLRLLDNQQLEDLGALAPLTSLESLDIENSAVKNLDALSGLRSLGSLFLQQNTQLTQIDGLSHLTQLRELRVGDNAALETLPLFANAACQDCSAGFQLSVGTNPVLRSGPGLPLIESADQFLIQNNAQLLSVAGWDGLKTVNTLFINDNPALQSVSLPQLAQAGGLAISHNSSLDDTPLAALRSVQSPSIKIVSNGSGPSLLSPCPWQGDIVCDEASGDCAPGTDGDCSHVP